MEDDRGDYCYRRYYPNDIIDVVDSDDEGSHEQKTSFPENVCTKCQQLFQSKQSKYPTLCDAAIANNHWQCLIQMHYGGVQASILGDAIIKKHVKCIRYLYEVCEFQGNEVSMALAINECAGKEIIDVLVRNKCPVDWRTVSVACKNGNLEYVKYFCENYEIEMEGQPVCAVVAHRLHNKYYNTTEEANQAIECLKYLIDKKICQDKEHRLLAKTDHKIIKACRR